MKRPLPWGNIVFGLTFLILAVLTYGFLWIGNFFYYEHGQTPPTEEDLNRLMKGHVLLLGIPLFISGLFFGNAINKN